MLRVLCVSRGHLCRSPMAAAVLRQMALEEGLGLVVDSAGAGALTVGSPPDRFATLVTERRGYRMGPVRGRRLKAYDYEIFDLILAMDDATWAGAMRRRPEQARAGVSMFSPTQPIVEPSQGDLAEFEVCLSEIESAARAFVASLLRGTVSASADCLVEGKYVCA